MFGFSLWDDHRRKPRKNPTHLHLQLYLCRTVSCAPKSWRRPGSENRVACRKRVEVPWHEKTFGTTRWRQMQPGTWETIADESHVAWNRSITFTWKAESMSPMSHTMGWFLQTQFSDDCNGVPRTPDGTPGTPIPIIFPSYGSNMGMGLPSGPLNSRKTRQIPLNLSKSPLRIYDLHYGHLWSEMIFLRKSLEKKSPSVGVRWPRWKVWSLWSPWAKAKHSAVIKSLRRWVDRKG